MHKTIAQVLKAISNYTGGFRDTYFYSGVELTAVFEDIFRLMTLEYSEEEDFSMDNFLKKKLLGGKKGIQRIKKRNQRKQELQKIKKHDQLSPNTEDENSKNEVPGINSISKDEKSDSYILNSHRTASSKITEHSYNTEKTSSNSLFVERFNNDPIFAFDSLLEIFYTVWQKYEPVENNKENGLSGKGK